VVIKIYIKTLDGITIFATHTIQVDNLTEDIRFELPFQIENINIIACYSQDELTKIINKLNELQLAYTIEEQIISQDIKDNVSNMKFNSRSEALKYLQNSIIPESEIIPTLGKKSIDLELENQVLGRQIVDLELRLLTLGG